MNSNNRRDFLKYASVGLVSPLHFLAGDSKKQVVEIRKAPALNIVCVGAHPGDPEFGCAGTMAKYADAGHKVTFLYLTRGEAYDANKSHSAAAAIRTKEAEDACAALKVTPKFFGQIDGSTEVNNKQNELFLKALSSLQPNIVYTHWPVDSHKDHQAAGLLTLAAWIKSNKSFDLYFYEVNSGSETMLFAPTEYVDISGVMNVKHDAMFAHQSQDPVGTYNNFFKKMEEFRGLEAGVNAAEAFVLLKGARRS